MSIHYLAIDLGASSGRHYLGWLENGKIRMEEIHRFQNRLAVKGGHICWDLDHLFTEIITGLKRCAELKFFPKYIGLDTWGVDFVLLGKDGRRLGEAVAYRDHRTEGVDQKLYEVIGEEELYSRNGIQKLIFNSIYQLYALKLSSPEILAAADSFLMIPDYFNYRLTGVKVNEYTNATTTQLVSAATRNWDRELMDRLGLPSGIFGEIRTPKSLVGPLSPEIAAEVGFTAQVVLPATHDTGSAVLAVPTDGDDSIYISSGTWSLMGIERFIPDCTEESRRHNFTNEGGYHYRYRYLKNIMGLWMVQSIRNEFKHLYTFPEIAVLAGLGSYFESVVEVNDNAFLSPPSMIEAVRNYCREHGLEVPETESEILACAYNSLARCYAETAGEIEAVCGREFDNIHIIGGGCQDNYLNKLTAARTGKQVLAGPVEATAIGNLLVQMLMTGELYDLPEARKVVRRSFPVTAVGRESLARPRRPDWAEAAQQA